MHCRSILLCGFILVNVVHTNTIFKRVLQHFFIIVKRHRWSVHYAPGNMRDKHYITACGQEFTISCQSHLDIIPSFFLQIMTYQNDPTKFTTTGWVAITSSTATVAAAGGHHMPVRALRIMKISRAVCSKEKKKRVFKVMIRTWHNFFPYTIPLCLAFRLLVRTREERKQPQPAKSLQLDSYLIDFKFCGGWFERRQTPLMEPFDGYSEKCCRRPSELIQPFTTRKLSPKFLRSQTSSAYNMKSLNFVKFADECSQIIKQHWTYKETASWSD